MQETRSNRGLRAQTSFDFLVGMSVFILTIGFVFAFVPGMFEPFSGNAGSGMLIAERSAARLAEDALVAAPTTPAILNATCTVEYFDADSNTADCRYDADASDLEGSLGLDTTNDLNITIEKDGAVSNVTAGGQSATLATGPTPPSHVSLVVAQRTVHLNGTDHRLFVRVW